MADESKSTPYSWDQDQDGRLYAPATERNRDVIRDLFYKHVADDARVLELACGSGQHSAHMLQKAPKMRWIASDVSEDALQSAQSWAKYEGLQAQYDGFVYLDASQTDWKISKQIDVLFSCNMIHIAPWEVAEGMFAGAYKYLGQDGLIFLYGPFKRKGEQVSKSNEDFDISLRGRDQNWGIRDLESEVIPSARNAGFELMDVFDMPANNFSVLFRRISKDK